MLLTNITALASAALVPLCQAGAPRVCANCVQVEPDALATLSTSAASER
jgi:hypothetical protein